MTADMLATSSMAATAVTTPITPIGPGSSSSPATGAHDGANGAGAAAGGLVVEDLGTRRLPTRHGMARLLPIRSGAEGRLVFAVDTFYGTRMTGHLPLLSGEGPRALLADATPLPAVLEDAVRTAYLTGRRHDLLVHRGPTCFAVELLADNGGVTVLWSEVPPAGREAPRFDGPGAAGSAALAGATVDGATVGCVVLRAERGPDGTIVDFECELSISDDEHAKHLPATGRRLGDVLPPAGHPAVVAMLGQLLESQRPFRPPRGLFGSVEIEQRCDLRAMAFADRAVVWLRTRPHTRSVVDLRELEQVSLTRREREILLLLAEGASTTEIARTLYLSTNTVRNHVRRLLSHLGASSRLEAVVIAAKMGLLQLRRDGES